MRRETGNEGGRKREEGDKGEGIQRSMENGQCKMEDRKKGGMEEIGVTLHRVDDGYMQQQKCS